MEPIAQLSAVLPTLSSLVDNVGPAQLYHPTPCDAFTVHDVLHHMIDGATTFARKFRGDEAPSGSTTLQYGWVPVDEFRAAMEGLLDAVGSEGAMDRVIGTPMGELDGSTFARFVALDGLVHGWDIATATGQPYDPPVELVDDVERFARQAITAALRDSGAFAAEVDAPDGARPIERLAAFTGRSAPRTITHRSSTTSATS